MNDFRGREDNRRYLDLNFWFASVLLAYKEMIQQHISLSR